jgi:anti-sigma factor RsiW
MTVEPMREEELHAYIDRALDAGRSRQIEAWLEEQPDVVRAVQAYREQGELLHATFDFVLTEPLPGRLTRRALGRRPVAAAVVGIAVLWLVVTTPGLPRRQRYGSPPADLGDRSSDGTSGPRDRDLVPVGRPAPSLSSFAARELPGESPGPVRPSRSSLAARELPGDAR